MSSVVISGDISGSVTLDAPSVAGTTVLTLPATSGTVLTQNPSAPANSLVVDSSGNVGIGTTSPTHRLNIYSNISAIAALDGDSATAFQGTRYSSDNTAPVFIGRKARGTLASPSAVNSGDLVNNIQGWAYGGSNFRTIASQRYAVETYTADDNISGYLSFLTRPTGVAASLIERMRITSDGLLQFNSGYGSVATAYGCRAWVNFNGTGVVAIRASGNVSSITDNGTGTYTVNFTTAMPDANYSWSGLCGTPGVTNGIQIVATPLAASVPITTLNTAFALFDPTYVTVMVMR